MHLRSLVSPYRSKRVGTGQGRTFRERGFSFTPGVLFCANVILVGFMLLFANLGIAASISEFA